MGIKQADLITPLASGPSPLNPSGKPQFVKVFQASRSDAVATLKAMLPAQSSILHMVIEGSVVSNAVTTATMTITVTNNSGTIASGVVDVKTNGAATAFVQFITLPNIEPQPLLGDLKINAVYADTGGAATLGGPWNFVVTYV
jgi:hypothetical protein